MLHQPNLSTRPASRLVSAEAPELQASCASPLPRGWTARAQMAADELAFRALVAFRSHSHLNNVLTHISGGDWVKVEQTLRFIFDPAAEHAKLSPLARNILDLLCAERGVTGRILKPFFRALLFDLLEPGLAARTIWRLTALYLGVDRNAREAMDAATTSINNLGPRSQNMSDPNQNERVIKVADIDPRYRHTIIFRLFEHLDPDHSVQLVVDHDPKPLRLQFETRYCERCEWTYLEEGPEVWRLRLRVLAHSERRADESDQRSFSPPTRQG